MPRSITLATFSSPCDDLDVVDDRVDRRERAQDLLDRHADLERRVALRVERLRRGHAAGHPQQDAGVGGRLRVLRPARREAAVRRRRGSRGRRRSWPGGSRGGRVRVDHGATSARSDIVQCLVISVVRTSLFSTSDRLWSIDDCRRDCIFARAISRYGDLRWPSAVSPSSRMSYVEAIKRVGLQPSHC